MLGDEDNTDKYEDQQLIEQQLQMHSKVQNRNDDTNKFNNGIE